MEELNILKTADLGQIPDSVSGSNDVLPKDVAAKIIDEITAANIMRQFVTKIVVPNRSLSVPRVLYGSDINAYKIGYGTDITSGTNEVAFSTAATVLEPQLLAAFTDMLELDLDTAGLDVANYVRKSLALTLARAEENCMIAGAVAGTTAYSSMFNGVYTLAASGSTCATTVQTFTNSDSLVDKIGDAIKELGVYGEDRGQLVCIAANTFANLLRKDAKIQQVGTYNQNEAGVTRTSVLPLIHGVKVVESSVLETKNNGTAAILMRLDGGLFGQRGDIILRKKLIEESFKVRVIMAEAIDFKWALYNTTPKAVGMVLIKHASS